ncbi:MAG: GTPase family protein [Oscillospiraceae bacterium]
MTEERLFDKLDELKSNVENSEMNEKDKLTLLKNIQNLRNQKVNILITGATGCGKSSTINALFEKDIAKVGVTPDPETMTIEKYEYDNLILWDSPGLGDGKENDLRHSKNIIKKLTETDADGNALIDLVLVIIDGSSRDMGTSYQLINNVIIPTMGKDRSSRILVAINQCDIAMKGKGHHWDYENNKPDAELTTYLEKQVESIHKRIKESTGVDITPIYYCAGYKDGDDIQRPYNLVKLMLFIIEHSPKEKRLVYAQNMSKDPDVWKDSDEIRDYHKQIKNSFEETFRSSISKGVETGAEIGEALFGTPGKILGGFIGGVAGAVGGFVKGLAGGLFG